MLPPILRIGELLIFNEFAVISSVKVKVVDERDNALPAAFTVPPKRNVPAVVTSLPLVVTLPLKLTLPPASTAVPNVVVPFKVSELVKTLRSSLTVKLGAVNVVADAGVSTFTPKSSAVLLSKTRVPVLATKIGLLPVAVKFKLTAVVLTGLPIIPIPVPPDVKSRRAAPMVPVELVIASPAVTV